MTATLTRRTPFGELEPIERRMRRLFNIGLAPLTMPLADVYETPSELVVELEVPGFDEKQLGIEVSDHTLTITGERKLTTEETERSFLLQERLESAFTRRFVLPSETDTGHVKAAFSNGVLEVHVPKLATTAPQKIEITTSD